jgi:histidinol-phosphatase (PHP family)
MQNLHTHTTYADGKLTPEEMILTAIETGCDSLGFSEHSYVPFDIYYSMTPEETRKYIDELRELREKYKNKLEIFIGLELDYYSPWRPKEGLDYILSTTQYIKVKDKQGNEKYVSVDSGAKRQREISEMYFDGDFYSLAEAYYGTIVDLTEKTNADIIGHFDLVAKYNNDSIAFDEEHPRYLKAALDTMDSIMKNCKLFELNTGAMHRVNRTEPYPSKRLLKELHKRGGEIIMTSDSHDGESLCHKFEEMAELLKSIGFKHQKRLTKNGFVDVEL